MALTWDDFKKFDSETWKEKAAADSKGKYEVDKLNYNVEGDFLVDAFITSQSTAPAPLTRIHTKSGLYLDIAGYSETVINGYILKHLPSGVDSLIIACDDNVELETLLAGVFPDMIEIILLTHGEKSILKKSVASYIEKINPSKRDQIAILVHSQFELSADQKFSDRLSVFNSQMQKLDQDETLLLKLNLKNDFIAQISELRALRTIWSQSGRSENNLVIIAVSYIGDTQDINPLIVTNYQLMSAVLGSSNIAAIVYSLDDEQVRLSLNLMHIFREESRLDFVYDPLAGAYLPEALTEQMVRFCTG